MHGGLASKWACSEWENQWNILFHWKAQICAYICALYILGNPGLQRGEGREGNGSDKKRGKEGEGEWKENVRPRLLVVTSRVAQFVIKIAKLAHYMRRRGMLSFGVRPRLLVTYVRVPPIPMPLLIPSNMQIDREILVDSSAVSKV